MTSAAASWWLLGVVLPAWNTPHTSIEGVVHARSALSPQPALARRATLLVVDGLSFEHAAGLDELARLRDEGATRPLIAHFPTYTGPNITAMLTGLAPRESGVRLNGVGQGVRGIDAATYCAWDAGVFLRIRGRTYRPFSDLARPPRQADVKLGRYQPLFDWELDRARPTPSAPDGKATLLELLYFGDVDETAHDHGTRSSAYREAEARAGRFVQRVMAELDPARDVLFVASDHAHRPSGGHGGVEPGIERGFFGAWGRGVRRGARLEARPMRDLAATLTLTVGAKTPSSNQGWPMLDVFELELADRARLSNEPFDQATRFGCAARETPSCAEVEGLRAALARGESADLALALVGRLADERDAAAEAEEGGRVAPRVLVGAAFGAGLTALAAQRGFGRPARWTGWLAPCALVASFCLALALIGYRPTLSTMTPIPVFAVDATIAGAAAAMATFLLSLRMEWGLREAALLPVMTFAALAPLWAVVAADPRALAPAVPSALVFMLSPAVPAAGVAAIALAVRAALRAARREERPVAGPAQSLRDV
ncbi:MAG: alkaline phosphatase family protein [Polyangiaceae bacterium]|nr:alkaline phosphatase family protein [Polyangiaceae bacterium]